MTHQFSNRHVPAKKKRFHTDNICMDIELKHVPSLLGTPGTDYQIDRLLLI